jgi:tRNA G10  N-methylase Trm11
MKRLTKHPPFEKALRPGELPPPLAYMLCRLSDPKGGQVAVDPFCGYGSILEARQKHFPPALFYASDIDKKVIAAAERRITGSLSPLCHVQKLDVRDIFSVVPEGAADAIITDPPWGIHAGLPVPAGRFYEDIAGIFGRLLKPGGTAVVLTARAGELKVGAEKSGVLELKETLPVLVSGRKASVLCLKKTETNRRDKKEGTESAGQGFC